MVKEPAKLQFAFGRRNYIYLLVGIAVVLLGFLLMSGGGSEDPDVFPGDYMLTDQSFDMMKDEWKIDEATTAKLLPIKDKVFTEEAALLSEVEKLIGEESFKEHGYEVRSSVLIEADMFSSRRITLAPLIVLLGYAAILYAILHKARRPETE
jgi:hypothetical protein